MRKSYFFFILLLSISLLQSCTKDPVEDPNQGVAPTLPPQETFIMSFAGFEDVDTSGFVSTGGSRFGEPTFRNWFHAGTNLLIWNTVLVLNMAIPVGAFAESFNHTAEYEGNGVFKWSYDYELAGQTYKASLTGQFVNNNEDVEWNMTISQVGGFTDVLWYTGIVAKDGTGGTWTLYHQPNNPQPYLSIESSRDLNTSESSIRYTNIIPNHPDNGHYIEYRTETDAEFNRAYDIFHGGGDKFLEIQWNAPTDEGRVKHPARFNDNEWHCWDIEKADVDC